MTAAQRQALVAICVIVGITFMVSAGLTFLITPLADDLQLDEWRIDVCLSLPSIGSLLIIFIAGRLGDRLGHRPVIIWSGAGFVIGALALAVAPSVHLVSVGLFVCGATATMIQVVALGLLQVTAPEGRSHDSAFTTYGMVFPIAYLVFPVATAQLVGVAQWRIVPLIWAIAGLLLIVMTRILLPRPGPRSPLGEAWTPLLAGLALTAGARAIGWAQEFGVGNSRAVGALVVCGCAMIVCAVLLRRRSTSSLSLVSLRSSMVRALLVGVAIVALVATLTFITLAMEVMFDLTAIEAAIVLIPAQVSAIVGAKIVALWSIRRWGVGRATLMLVGGLGISTLLLIGMRADSALWFLCVCAIAINGFGMSAVTTLNTDVMGRAPVGEETSVAALRGAASAVGTTLAVFVLGAGVTSAIDTGGGVVTRGRADLEAIASALRVDGVISFVLVLALLLLLGFTARRAASTAPSSTNQPIS